MSSLRPAVHVVHCIDTEGPLYESIDATFDRLRSIFQLQLEPSRELLRQLQAGTFKLDGLEKAVQKVLDPRLLAYNDTWDKVNTMLEDALSPEFRCRLPDSHGNGWVFNWFCVDHVGSGVNPRRRDMGFHNVFDEYRRLIRDTNSVQDGLHFHFHPQNFRQEAHRCATHWWASSDNLWQILSRRVIDRLWFPAANRPGYHVIRPDSHWFLEQHVPFDFSSQAVAPTEEDAKQFGLSGGRFGDWRRAPVTWVPYHPSHDDYQVPGDCRRWIARCLNIGTRYRLLSEQDVRQAFSEAQSGKPVVLGVTNHDFRDLRPDVDEVRHLVARISREFPEVPFRHCEAVEAMRLALELPPQPPCPLEILVRPVGPTKHILEVQSDVPTFGPQPWLALKTKAGDYYHDNFDIEIPFHRWQYVFDEETFPLAALQQMGIAANNAYGVTTVCRLDVETGEVVRRHWNQPAPTSIRQIRH